MLSFLHYDVEKIELEFIHIAAASSLDKPPLFENLETPCRKMLGNDGQVENNRSIILINDEGVHS
jgi:hypothetical protein